MNRTGFTGHQNLSKEIEKYVVHKLWQLLADRSDLVGISSLAAGADQVFAEVVLSLNGSLEIIVPAEHYEDTFENAADLQLYTSLLSQAAKVTTLPFVEPSENAYMAAGQEIVRRSDSLIAVWDGQPARGRGGTADIVEYAKACKVPVTVVWPLGQTRD